MDAAELEKMCRDHNLSAEGSADELRGRIICHLFPEIEDEAEDEDEDDDGDAIESILDHRKTRRGTYEFHVSFCSGESFWSALEPVHVDAPDLVSDYLRSSGLSSTEPDFVWAKDGVETDDARSIIIDAERERILRMTCSELRLELTKNGLNTKGKKNVLQERLLADEDEDDSIPEDSVHIPREKRASDRVDDGTEGRRTRQRR
mmetsp:Transcript_30088/g.61072  ORF Transcript_30088/g.61072 Transcript_30088/m.61072 type:complete len:204 (+) Transcript_30088:810-1421(+)